MDVQLFHWVYASKAADRMTDEHLDALLEKARASNAHQNITGVLLYAEDSFLQVLEGPRESLEKLSKKIMRDSRHCQLETLRFERKAKRDFPDWKMGYMRLDNSPLPEGYFPALNRFFSTYQLTEDDTESFYFIESFRRQFLD